MFKEKLILTFYALTPIHMGSGTSVSYVDNPIQREKHTDYPVLAASGIKGVIRDLAERSWQNKNKVNVIFGPEAGEGDKEYASCIAFTDAKILLYPVRSVKGVFAYITCPYVLNRFKDELKSIGIEDLFRINNFKDVKDEQIIICKGSKLQIDDNKVALEEFVFEIDSSKKKDLGELADALSKYLSEKIDSAQQGEANSAQQKELTLQLKERLAIVSDNVFKDFVKYAVEIRTRIRIDQTKGTVTEGALFTIELVPAESVFYGFLFMTDPRFGIEPAIYEKLKNGKESNKSFDEAFNSLTQEEKGKIKADEKEQLKKAYENDYFMSTEIKNGLDKILNNSLIQFGGDETLGMGLMKVKIS